MRNRLQYLSRYLPWFLLLLGLDAMSALLLWLSDAKAFAVLLPMILFATVLLFIAVAFVLARAEQRKENAFRVFLNHPDALNEEKLRTMQKIRDYHETISLYMRTLAHDGMVSLTELARQYSDESPGYVIQSWMRIRNTLEFL